MTKRKTPKGAKPDTVEVNMSLQLATPDAGVIIGTDAIDDILANLDAQDAQPLPVAVDTDAIIDGAMQAPVIDNESIYQAQDAALAAAAVPTTAADKPSRKAKGEKVAKVKVAKVKVEKAPAAPRVTYAGNARSAVLANRLGAGGDEFLALETADALLTPEQFADKATAFKDELDTKIAKKVAEKCIMLMKDLKAGGKVKNEVMRTAFEVLATQGKLTSGDKGNLQTALSAKYSLGTSRSQSNQMFCLFPFLRITTRGDKGVQVPNPESTIVASVYTRHNLTQAAVAA